jgi:UPF0716 family protein affecting phage T7 exclusion
MLIRLFVIFSIVPIIEIRILIKVGKVIGALPAVALLLVISFVGAWLAKSQGLRTVTAIRNDPAAAHLPDGACNALNLTEVCSFGPDKFHQIQPVPKGKPK